MPTYLFFWTDENEEHVAEHGVTREEFEWVVQRAKRRGVSKTSGRPTAQGLTRDGRLLYCVYEMLDVATVLPVTAFFVRVER